MNISNINDDNILYNKNLIKINIKNKSKIQIYIYIKSIINRYNDLLSVIYYIILIKINKYNKFKNKQIQ